jgi:hypothetical protein
MPVYRRFIAFLYRIRRGFVVFWPKMASMGNKHDKFSDYILARTAAGAPRQAIARELAAKGVKTTGSQIYEWMLRRSNRIARDLALIDPITAAKAAQAQSPAATPASSAAAAKPVPASAVPVPDQARATVGEPVPGLAPEERFTVPPPIQAAHKADDAAWQRFPEMRSIQCGHSF